MNWARREASFFASYLPPNSLARGGGWRAKTPCLASTLHDNRLLSCILVRSSVGLHAGEKWHLVRVGRGRGRGWGNRPGLASSLAEVQGHYQPASRLGP